MMRARLAFSIAAQSALLALIAIPFSAVCWSQEQNATSAPGNIFARQNLVAWCVVPFDASNRTPAERAEMLERLGFTKLAYDWRDNHIPTFEDEILCLRKHNIEFFAHWMTGPESPGYQPMMQLFEKYQLHPQLWIIAPAMEAASQQERVEVNARALLPFVADAKRLGCKLGLYNHGGWSGEPENMIAMTQWLREHAETEDVGIVYNLHHGHEHLARFAEALKAMQPYLLCLNLNGMNPAGPKILPLGQGTEDLRILKIIRDSAYHGPLGILDHREDTDAEISLRQNLSGLRKLLVEMGEQEAAATYLVQ